MDHSAMVIVSKFIRDHLDKSCERVVYDDQVYFMRQYLAILEGRAKTEGVILE